MTGTGTQADPYIVDSWVDFVSIDKTNSPYIEWDKNAENKVVDFNEICPQGYSSAIKMGRHTKYNGWVFRNFYSTANTALNFGDAGIYITGLNFENFYWQPISTSFFLDCDGNYGRRSVFYNCIFSGKIAVPGSACFCSQYLTRCALNLSISSLSDTFKISSENIESSDIVLDVVKSSAFEMSYYNVKNSRISGKISASSIKISGSSGGYNVVSLESDTPLKYIGSGISVYNSDLAEKTSDSTNFIGCTTEQLKNAEYLYSIGFPIGIE